MEVITPLSQDLNLVIAIVDDDDDVALSLKYVLKSIGIDNTITFSSAADFLNSDGIEQFDLIYTDLIMDDISGFDLIETLKQRRLETPIVVVSALCVNLSMSQLILR